MTSGARDARRARASSRPRAASSATRRTSSGSHAARKFVALVVHQPDAFAAHVNPHAQMRADGGGDRAETVQGALKFLLFQRNLGFVEPLVEGDHVHVQSRQQGWQNGRSGTVRIIHDDLEFGV